MDRYLPWDDVVEYLFLIGMDGAILLFWWFVMSHLGDV